MTQDTTQPHTHTHTDGIFGLGGCIWVLHGVAWMFWMAWVLFHGMDVLHGMFVVEGDAVGCCCVAWHGSWMCCVA